MSHRLLLVIEGSLSVPGGSLRGRFGERPGPRHVATLRVWSMALRWRGRLVVRVRHQTLEVSGVVSERHRRLLGHGVVLSPVVDGLASGLLVVPDLVSGSVDARPPLVFAGLLFPLDPLHVVVVLGLSLILRARISQRMLRVRGPDLLIVPVQVPVHLLGDTRLALEECCLGQQRVSLSQQVVHARHLRSGRPDEVDVLLRDVRDRVVVLRASPVGADVVLTLGSALDRDSRVLHPRVTVLGRRNGGVLGLGFDHVLGHGLTGVDVLGVSAGADHPAVVVDVGEMEVAAWALRLSVVDQRGAVAVSDLGGLLDAGGLAQGSRHSETIDPQHEGCGVSGVLDQEAVLEEPQAVAPLGDQHLFGGPRGSVDPADLHALHPRDVLAVLRWGVGLVAARGAHRVLDVGSHRGARDVSCDNGLGETGEPDGVDLHEHLGPGVRGSVWVDVLVEDGVDDDASGSSVVGVVVVDEDRLADEGAVGPLDLLGRELVEVVVAARGDGPRPDIDVSG